MRIIGIDLGGTMVKGALFDDDKVISSSKRPSFGSEGKEAIMASLKGEIASLMEPRVEAIGIASAGVIDPHNGLCVSATDNLKGWGGVRIKEEIDKEFSLPVAVENDAIAALIGERSVEDEKDDLTLLTFGTGVGGASFVNGKIDRSPLRAYGHRVIVENGRPCNCGKKGCAEAYLSATALLRSSKEVTQKYQNTFEIMEGFRQGEKEAIEIMSSYGHYLALLLALIVREISPKKIILGGGLMGSEDVMRTLIPPEFLSRVAFAKLSNLAGATGASLLAREERQNIMKEKKNEEYAVKPLKEGLIVSCQALKGEPLFGGNTMAKMAFAAYEGGADGIRANGVKDINSIAKKLDGKLPIIGIIKRVYQGSMVYITPTLKEVKALISSRCDVIALDCTSRPRPNGEELANLVSYIRAHSAKRILADTATMEDISLARSLGFDYISTTMRGYTEGTKNCPIPDFAYLEKLSKEGLLEYLVAEGGVKSPEELERVIALGFRYVVIGGAITRPLLITERFKKVFEKA